MKGLSAEDDLPVAAVGDFNTFQYTNFTPHDLMLGAGFVDPLGVKLRSRQPSAGATAEKRINTHFDSFNEFKRRANIGPTTKGLNGTYLDYIFTSTMRVAEYEHVVNVDASRNFRGAIPSDHNMQRADVILP